MDNQFPPNVVLYLHQEIKARSAYKRQLEGMLKPPTFKLVESAEYKAEQERLQANLVKLTKEIIETTKEYLPSIKINQTSDELAIAGILSVMPPPEEMVVRKIFQGQE